MILIGESPLGDFTRTKFQPATIAPIFDRGVVIPGVRQTVSHPVALREVDGRFVGNGLQKPGDFPNAVRQKCFEE